MDLEENEYGITCIAVPIFDHSGKVIAAGIRSGPTMRMTEQRIDLLQLQMIQIGKKISTRLGF